MILEGIEQPILDFINSTKQDVLVIGIKTWKKLLNLNISYHLNKNRIVLVSIKANKNSAPISANHLLFTGCTKNYYKTIRITSDGKHINRKYLKKKMDQLYCRILLYIGE